MPVEMRPAQIDFSALANLGQIPERLRMRGLRGQFASGDFIKDGVLQYDKMIAALGAVNPTLAAKYASEKAALDSLTNYRTANTEPDDLKMWREYNRLYGGDVGGVEPFRLGSAPPAMFDKFRPSTEVEAEKAKAAAVGKAAGEREGQAAKKVEQSANVQAAIEDTLAAVEAFDDTSFENALGPWQGSGGTDTLSAASAFLPQTIGAVRNWAEGGKQSTSEIRSAVIGSTEALAAAIKPLIRAPGEGIWTDADQARLVSIVGDLQFSKDKAELKRRMRGVLSRVNAAFGLNVKVDFDKIGKDQSPPMDMAIDPPTPPVAGPQPRKVQTVPIAAPTQAGAVTPPPVTTDTPRIPKGSPQERQMLQWANEAIQQGADPAAVVQRLREMGIEQ